MKYLSIISFVLCALVLGGQENTGKEIAGWVYPTVLGLIVLGVYSANRALNKRPSSAQYMGSPWVERNRKSSSDRTIKMVITGDPSRPAGRW